MTSEVPVPVPVPTLLDEIELGSGRGGRRVAAPLVVEIVRALTEEDLEALQAPMPVGASYRPIAAIRESHHRLAQLIAKGVEPVEAGLITGYSQAYISSLTNHDPAFRELLSYYSIQREQAFVDVLEQMKALGIETLEMLRESIRDDPDAWSNREKMELAELMLVKPMAAARGAGQGAGPGVSIGKLEVSFVSPQAKRPDESVGVTIDVTPGQVEGEC